MNKFFQFLFIMTLIFVSLSFSNAAKAEKNIEVQINNKMQCIYQCVEQKPCNTPGVDDLCTQECIKECSSATSQSSEKDNSQAIAGFAPSTEGSKNYEICVSACELLSSDWATRVCKKECGLIQ